MFPMVVAGGAKHLAAVGGGHGFLLFGAHDQHHVAQATQDLLGRGEDGDSAGSAGGFHVQRWQAAHFVVDLRQERAEMKLPGEQPAGKIANHSRLDVLRTDGGIGDGRAGGLQNDVAHRLALLEEVAFEVGAPGANDIYRFGHNHIATGS